MNGQADQLFSAREGARRGAAEQLARRARPVDSGDRDEDAARAAARQRRTVDAVPHSPGVDEGRRAWQPRSTTSRAITRARARSCAAAAAACSSATSAAVGAFAGDPRIELHGPGYSKVVFGADAAPTWRESLDADRQIDRRERRPFVRQRLGRVDAGARPRDRRRARRRASRPLSRARPTIRRPRSRRSSIRGSRGTSTTRSTPGLAEPGAEDITARHRSGPRLVERDGSTYLLPTVIHCTTSAHPLANREFLFPYASVVDVTRRRDARRCPSCLGPDAVGHGAHATIRRSSIACCSRISSAA